MITHVNGMSLANWTFNSAVRAIQTQARPLTIQVVNPPAEPEPEPESVRISKALCFWTRRAYASLLTRTDTCTFWMRDLS